MRGIVIAILALTTIGCAGVPSDYDTPTVKVRSFLPVTSGGALPDFEIVLRVVNPNREPLKLTGLAYTIALEGRDLMTGVSNDLPTIPAYGEGDLSVTASVSLIQGFQLLRDLMETPRDRLAYTLTAKLDLGTFYPALRIKDSGEVAFAPQR